MRDSGYYWIKFDDEWMVAEYTLEHRCIMKCGHKGVFKITGEDYFMCGCSLEVDERKIVRGE